MTEVIEKTEYKKGYKKTKLGWIPEDWEILKFKEMYNFLSTGSNSRNELNSTGEYLYIHYGDIHCKYKNILNCSKIEIPHINKDKVRNLPELKDKDLIFVDASEDYEGITKCTEIKNVNNRKIVSGLHTLLLRPKKDISPGYGGYIASNPIVNKNIKKMANGWKVYGISKDNLSKIFFILPTKKEQEKIAEILSAWDDGIETLEKLIEQKEILKTSLAQKYFQRKNNLFPLKQQKLEELFTNRKETNCCDLELLSVCDGLGIIPRSQLNAKDNSNEDKSKYLKVCIGDLAYNTMRMWQGRCGVSSYEGIVSPAYTVCIPKDNIDVDYMYYLFKTPHMIHDFWRYSQGIVDDTLNLKFNNFKVIKVWIPDKGTQTKIAKLLKSYDEEIQLLNSKLEKLKEQKKGLMQKLLTGQIRVKI